MRRSVGTARQFSVRTLGRTPDASFSSNASQTTGTYSNLENHPRLIRVRDSRKTPKIRLDPSTGLPLTSETAPVREKSVRTAADRTVLQDEVLGGNQTLRNGMFSSERCLPCLTSPFVVPAARTRGESKEDKAARKAAIKEQKSARRVEKKVMKETFTREKQQQVKTQIARQQGGVGLKKL